ncbi:MAG: PAS domain-containing protein [Pseudomonadota bacterium]
MTQRNRSGAVDAIGAIGSSRVSRQPLVRAVVDSAVPTVLTDPTLPDNPIVFANDSFLQLIGYPEEEVLGRNCKFIQGPDTDPATCQRIREAVAAREKIVTEILNYRKDGTPFWNQLHIAPVLDEAGEAVYFVGSQIDVTARIEGQRTLVTQMERLEREVEERKAALQQSVAAHELNAREVVHRVRNSLFLLGALIEVKRNDAKDAGVREVLREIGGRINAVARIQGLLENVGSGRAGRRIDLSHALSSLCQDLDALALTRVRLQVSDPPEISPEQALPATLAITELVLNAQKHAFGGNGEGEIVVRLGSDGGGLAIEVEDNGPGLPMGFDPERSRGTGMMVVLTQTRLARGRLSFGEAESGGASFRVWLPIERPA